MAENRIILYEKDGRPFCPLCLHKSKERRREQLETQAQLIKEGYIEEKEKSPPLDLVFVPLYVREIIPSIHSNSQFRPFLSWFCPHQYANHPEQYPKPLKSILINNVWRPRSKTWKPKTIDGLKYKAPQQPSITKTTQCPDFD